ncbi:hypothetical protein [Lentibacillus saliphilus]|uniref:hypothetical protein n=1 Tax=Lentibacillus saliphilus TaxID=2737028 RepID=UPI001C2FDB0C|nr:hypothetical protein [Lentibacillus saliphilus]
MNHNVQSPKSFGQLLDQTFRLSKRYFKAFFLVILIITGPVYLFDALVLLASGTSFVTEVSSGDTFVDRIMSSVEQSESINIFSDLMMLLSGLILLVLGPVAMVAILHGVKDVYNGRAPEASDIMKRAFSRFGPIAISSIIVGLIFIAAIVVPFLFLVFFVIAGSMIEPFFAIGFTILLGLGLFLGIVLLAARLGFYLGPVAFEGDMPGISRSWELTKGQTWKLVGLFLIFILITTTITSVFDGILMFILGYSVLHTILISLITIILNTIMYVGFAVIYFDLKVRNDADDLKDLIADYEEGAAPTSTTDV